MGGRLEMTVADGFRELFERRRRARDDSPDLLEGREGVVLAGAGTVGRQFLDALRSAKVPVFAFADNGPDKWGARIGGVPVMAPSEAVPRFGRQAVHVLTIGRIGKEIAAVREQYSVLGADRILHFIEAIPRLPEIWPRFFLDPEAFREDDGHQCAGAFELLSDDESRQHFQAHLAWRAALDPSQLAIPTYDDQYFPAGVIEPRHCASFIDIGAYTGDTLGTLVRFAGPSLRRYDGFEPDPGNFARLKDAASAYRPSAAIEIHRIAVGASSGTTCFDGNGSATSRLDVHGDTSVRCARLDDLRLGRPTYIKIDVEGGEDDVLRGADRTLAAAQPVVAIATYHRPRDLFELPLRLSRYAADYRFYLRSHGDAGIDLVCYAVRAVEAA
ncbi:MAG: FkbM family methyltransferase [Vicinamibacterales bacterium]